MKLEGDFWDKIRAHPGYTQSKRWQERYGMTVTTHMDNAVILTCEPATVPPPPTLGDKQTPFQTVPSEARSQQQRMDAHQWDLWYREIEQLYTVLVPTVSWFRENARQLDEEQRELAVTLEQWGCALFVACLRYDQRAYWPVRYRAKDGAGTLIDALQFLFPNARRLRVVAEKPMEMPF